MGEDQADGDRLRFQLGDGIGDALGLRFRQAPSTTLPNASMRSAASTVRERGTTAGGFASVRE